MGRVKNRMQSCIHMHSSIYASPCSFLKPHSGKHFKSFFEDKQKRLFYCLSWMFSPKHNSLWGTDPWVDLFQCSFYYWDKIWHKSKHNESLASLELREWNTFAPSLQCSFPSDHTTECPTPCTKSIPNWFSGRKWRIIAGISEFHISFPGLIPSKIPRHSQCILSMNTSFFHAWVILLACW